MGLIYYTNFPLHEIFKLEKYDESLNDYEWIPIHKFKQIVIYDTEIYF